MKVKKTLIDLSAFASISLFAFAPFFSPQNHVFARSVKPQFGNTISGIVFGVQRQPVNNVDVELLGEFSRFIARTQTTSSGRYSFNGLRAGRYQVKVLPLNTGYEQQTQEYEIINLSVQSPGGGIRTGGFENAQVDFHLKPRRITNNDSAPGIIFVQEDVPSQAVKVYKKAVKALEDKEDEKAVSYLNEALNLFPDYFLALERLGTEYVRLKKYQEARDILTKAVTINNRGYNCWYALGQAQYVLKNYEGAIDAAKKALDLSPNSLNALILSSISFKEYGRYEEAEAQLKKADQIGKGGVSEVHWQLAKLYADKLKRYGKAADELELYLKIESDHPNRENIKKLVGVFREKDKNQNK